MYKRFFLTITIVLFSITFALSGALNKQLSNTQAQDIGGNVGTVRVEAVYFYQDTCGVCREVKPTIDELETKYNLDLKRYEVTESNENRSRFGAYANAYGISPNDNHVPVIYMGDDYFMGYDPITKDLEPAIEKCEGEDPVCQLKIKPNSQEALTYDFTGNISCTDGTKCETPESNSKISLLVIIPAAIVDSINPCAIAVLILLVTYLMNIKWSKRKMLLFGFIYIGSVFTAYLLAGLGLLKILNSV
ncbi:thioredoxin family protein, partial [Candidatus Dojkabacteria bacterium]|nr:thioredoxin family protein [Candidatus Dojkabacteria bacterium]